MQTNFGMICDKITSHRCPSNPLGQFLKKKRENFKLDIHGTVGLL